MTDQASFDPKPHHQTIHKTSTMAIINRNRMKRLDLGDVLTIEGSDRFIDRLAARALARKKITISANKCLGHADIMTFTHNGIEVVIK